MQRLSITNILKVFVRDKTKWTASYNFLFCTSSATHFISGYFRIRSQTIMVEYSMPCNFNIRTKFCSRMELNKTEPKIILQCSIRKHFMQTSFTIYFMARGRGGKFLSSNRIIQLSSCVIKSNKALRHTLYNLKLVIKVYFSISSYRVRETTITTNQLPGLEALMAGKIEVHERLFFQVSERH